MNINMQKLPLSYYFNWTGIEAFHYNFDTRGIPRVDYGGKIGLRYNPITTAQYGLYRLHCFDEKDEEQDLQAAVQCADWLVENLQESGSVHAWIYDFDLNWYGPKAPWISGMAQGEGISLLLRINQLLGKQEYLDTAKRAFQPFTVGVADGGVRDYLSEETIIFEEFPTEPPSHVLNGHIFALLGVYDYGMAFEDPEAQKLFQDACIGLAKNLFRWDCGFWCLYDLHPTHRLASRMYMKVHIQLLNILYDLSNQTEFQQTAIRWNNYLRNPAFQARWAGTKVIEKIRLFHRNRS